MRRAAALAALRRLAPGLASGPGVSSLATIIFALEGVTTSSSKAPIT